MRLQAQARSLRSQLLNPLPPDSPLSDGEVVARVRGGEVGWYEVLMRRHNQRLYRVVRALISDEDEIEDVMQQAYIAAFVHLDQYAERVLFSTWLCRIGVNEALARIRHGRRMRGLDGPEGSVADSPVDSIASGVLGAAATDGAGALDPEEAASRHQLVALLEAAVERLPEIYRLVFLLREVEELSTAACAECLSVSEEVIKVRLHRARHLLRDALGPKLDAGGAHVAEIFAFHAPRCDRVVAQVLARIAERRRGAD